MSNEEEVKKEDPQTEELEDLLEQNNITITDQNKKEQLIGLGLAGVMYMKLQEVKDKKPGFHILKIKNPTTEGEHPLEIKKEKSQEQLERENENEKENESNEVQSTGSSAEQSIVLMSKFQPRPFVEKLSEFTDFVYDKYQTLWRFDYSEGIWKSDAEQWVRTQLRKKVMGDEQQKKQYVEEIVSYIKDYYYDENFEPNQNPYLIALKNKIYDLENEKFLDFSPKFSITNKLQIEVNGKNKSCPNIDKFFEDSVGKEYKQILYDLCAYCLFKSYPYQKAFFIYGPANTGKSVFMNFLERFLGHKNYSSIGPKQISSGDKHAPYNMWQMSANLVSDIDYRELEDITILKKITGGDSILMRPMYSSGFKAHLFAKQIFSTNKIPSVRQKTKAWYRRVYIIPFMKEISNKKRDPLLIERITQKGEMEGFVNKCLDSLVRMKKRNWLFTYDIDVDTIASVYEKFSNPIHMFINENCQEENPYSNKEAFIYKWEFKESLNKWLKRFGFPTFSNAELNRYMKEHYNESNRKAPMKDKYYRVWSGLTWNTQHPQANQKSDFDKFNEEIKKAYVYRGNLEETNNSFKRIALITKPFDYHQELMELLKAW